MVKTKYLLIGSRSKINNLTSEPNIVINNRPIKRVTETKSLGILMDHLHYRLNFDLDKNFITA
jgi:hypothetical protein